MDLQEVLRRRRMTRRYASRAVDPATVHRVVRAGLRAPSAGFAQGWGFLVLDRPDVVDAYWAATTDPGRAPDAWLRGMRTAPVLVVAWSCEQAYRQRYAAPDKQASAQDWRIPWWHVDTAMAGLLMLLAAEDEGLGACWFGVPATAVDPLRDAFGVPADHEPVGVVSLGHWPAGPDRPRGSATRRPRRGYDEVVHRGRWA